MFDYRVSFTKICSFFKFHMDVGEIGCCMDTFLNSLTHYQFSDMNLLFCFRIFFIKLTGSSDLLMYSCVQCITDLLISYQLISYLEINQTHSYVFHHLINLVTKWWFKHSLVRISWQFFLSWSWSKSFNIWYLLTLSPMIIFHPVTNLARWILMWS